MRNREPLVAGSRHAGHHLDEFFDASLLLSDDVSFADGLLQPDGPGYRG